MAESPKYAEEVRSMPSEAGLAPVDPPAPAAAPPAAGALVPGPVPGRLVLQDEGAGWVILDSYATGRREPLASIMVRRDVLALYALDLLRAGLRR